MKWLREVHSQGNPYRSDWTQKAWEHLRGKIGKGDPAGCREIDMRLYREAVKAIDGVNLCEKFYTKPYPRTHFGNDFLRKGNHGQRIDHIVVSRSLPEGNGPHVTAFEVLQSQGGFMGTSDHCPVWCEIGERREVVVVGRKGLNEHPYLTLEVEGQKAVCLLDTGSAITIFNPAEGRTASTDTSFNTLRRVGGCSMKIRSYAGEMVAEERVEAMVEQKGSSSRAMYRGSRGFY